MKKLVTTVKNNHIIFIIIVAVAAAVLACGVAFAYSKKNNSQPNCKRDCVALRENKADPDTLAVKIGSYVQFNSADGKTHNLSLGKGGEHHSHTGTFSSGDFKSDEAWRVQFKKEGTYSFHDHYNPKINVIIVVYTPGKEYKVE